MRDSHGHYGSAAPHGSTPRRISEDEIARLPDGARVVITWVGGNGPHLYQICDESVPEFEYYHMDPFGVRRSEVIRYGDYVSLEVSQ